MDKNTEEFEGVTGGKTSISADLIRGHINTIILRSLYDKDKYGYEIINEINEKTHGQYTLKQPTLYSALKRLENQGYIQAYWKNDEVSSGGRRKYFRLTDRGREITEHNQAEWEYSRTVIDNLISDRNFDFNQPAPTPVDFKILKQATSRVPVVHDEDDEFAEFEENDEHDKHTGGTPSVEARTYTVSEDEAVYIEDPTKPEENEPEPEPSIVYTSETEKPLSYSEQLFESGIKHNEPEDKAPGPEPHEQTEESAADIESAVSREPLNEERADDHTESAHEEIKTEESKQPYRDDAPFRPEELETEKARYTSQLSQQMDEESRRQLHENYLKLISGDDDRQTARQPDIGYEPVQDELIYNSRPEQERDYKNLIDKLFDNTLNNTEPIPQQPQMQAQPQPQYQEPLRQQMPEPDIAQPAQTVKYSGYAEVVNKAASDGIKISTSEDAFAAGSVKQKTYNKGATLFKCSLIVGVIMIVEFIITLALRNSLGVGIAYPIVILALGLATVIVCGILYATHYGTHMRKPATLRYIITACIITVLLIVIIILFGVIIQTNWTAANEIMANIVIPCIIALNIPIFTLSFYLFTKN